MPFAVRLALLLLAGLLLPTAAHAKADQSRWPPITGALLINKATESRPLDARPGADPFGGTDPTYRCDGDHLNQACFVRVGACQPHSRKTNRCEGIPRFPAYNYRKHNELLGGGGDDVIHAGPFGDVIWGDHRYPQNPLTQRDRLYGGAGNDWIYASHGHNVIFTGGGVDRVMARYGRGEIHCQSRTTFVRVSRRSKPRYRFFGCRNVAIKAVGLNK